MSTPNVCEMMRAIGEQCWRMRRLVDRANQQVDGVDTRTLDMLQDRRQSWTEVVNSFQNLIGGAFKPRQLFRCLRCECVQQTNKRAVTWCQRLCGDALQVVMRQPLLTRSREEVENVCDKHVHQNL